MLEAAADELDGLLNVTLEEAAAKLFEEDCATTEDEEAA